MDFRSMNNSHNGYYLRDVICLSLPTDVSLQLILNVIKPLSPKNISPEKRKNESEMKRRSALKRGDFLYESIERSHKKLNSL